MTCHTVVTQKIFTKGVRCWIWGGVPQKGSNGGGGAGEDIMLDFDEGNHCSFYGFSPISSESKVDMN